METVVDTVGQVEQEQHLIDLMYARLDVELTSSAVMQDQMMTSPVEGAEARYARDVEVSRLAGVMRRLRSAEHSLCFGRIDGVDGDSALHVGRIGLRSEAGEILLVDWRAEAARPFYAATPAVSLGVRRRRHLRIDDRSVVEITDEILDGSAPTDADIVGDGPLVSALNGARTGRMREAAATLQEEQDEIVRSEHRGIMVVDGGPGTGKTIVALHRAAYVLYAFPTIAERGVLVFGPNQRFLTYISHVLPSLGENDVELATTPDLVGVSALRTESETIARIKGRGRFAEVLARWVRARQPQALPLRLTTAHGTSLIDASRVDAARRSALQGDPGHNRARELFLEQIVDDVVSDLEVETAKEDADFEGELRDLLGIDLDRLFAGDDGHSRPDGGATAGGMGIDWDRIRDELLDDAAIDRAVGEVWPRLHAEDVVRGALSDATALAQVLPELADEDVASMAVAGRNAWSSADLALLDEARALVDGPPDRSFGHIVVDEAQLLSEMEYRMLMRRCPNRSMTIVGDLAQAGPTTTVDSWAGALEPFVGDRWVHHSLTINYRTTAEILEASEPVLARIAPTQRLSGSLRHGEHPTVVTCAEGEVRSTLDRLLARLREERPDELIGVVAATGRAADLGARDLGSGVVVVAAPDARGLEFDTVVIVVPAEIEHAGAAGLRDLYVAQTRATKRLITLTTVASESDHHRHPRDLVDLVADRRRPGERRFVEPQ